MKVSGGLESKPLQNWGLRQSPISWTISLICLTLSTAPEVAHFKLYFFGTGDPQTKSVAWIRHWFHASSAFTSYFACRHLAKDFIRLTHRPYIVIITRRHRAVMISSKYSYLIRPRTGDEYCNNHVVRIQSFPKFRRMLPMADVRSCPGGVATCYLLMVLWMTSRLNVTARSSRRQKCIYSKWLNRRQHKLDTSAYAQTGHQGNTAPELAAKSDIDEWFVF